jgi:hypothetical protein
MIFFFKELLFETEESVYAHLTRAGIFVKTIQFGGFYTGYHEPRDALRAAYFHSRGLSEKPSFSARFDECGIHGVICAKNV